MDYYKILKIVFNIGVGTLIIDYGIKEIQKHLISKNRDQMNYRDYRYGCSGLFMVFVGAITVFQFIDFMDFLVDFFINCLMTNFCNLNSYY